MSAKEFTDAIALLKSDHRKIEELFAQFDKAQQQDRKQALAQEICIELKIHTMIEEELLYPALRGKVDEDLLDEAYVEHDGAKVLVNDLSSAYADEDFYDAKVKVLAEEIRHHVAEEERPAEGMFAQARAAKVDLVTLRDAMLVRKHELVRQSKASGLPPATPSVVRLVAR